MKTNPSETYPVISIPFKLQMNKLVLPVQVNELEPVDFVMDTGAPSWLLDIGYVQAIGLKAAQSNDLIVTGASGDSLGQAQVIPELKMSLGGLVLEQQTAIAIPLPQPRGKPMFHGIVGSDFISRFVVEIDFSGQVLYLHEPSTYTYQGEGTILPIRIMNGHPHAIVRVTSMGGESIDADFVFDLGAGMTLTFNTPFVETYQLLKKAPKVVPAIIGFGVGGAVHGYAGRLQAIQIGSVDIREPVVYFATSRKGATAQAGFAGNIGMEILRRFRVILDYLRKQIILEKTEHLDEPYDHDMSGMAFTPAGEHMRIELIVEGGPAAEAGLQVGDLITHVNGQRAIDVDILELRQKFRSAAGTHRISATRGGDQLDVALTPRRLI